MENLKTLYETVWQGTNSWEYEAIYQFRGEKLRVEIDRDAYDFQSSAVISIWDPPNRKWNFLANIPYRQLACLVVSYVTPPESFERDQDIEHFRKDSKSLLEKAALILPKLEVVK